MLGKMRPKAAVDCYACGCKVEGIDPERIISRGEGWVKYRCSNCEHIMHVYVEYVEEEIR